MTILRALVLPKSLLRPISGLIKSHGGWPLRRDKAAKTPSRPCPPVDFDVGQWGEKYALIAREQDREPGAKRPKKSVKFIGLLKREICVAHHIGDRETRAPLATGCGREAVVMDLDGVARDLIVVAIVFVVHAAPRRRRICATPQSVIRRRSRHHTLNMKVSENG